MQIRTLKLLPIQLQFQHPFSSAHETLTTRDLVIVQVIDDKGNQGLGELDAFTRPFYNDESLITAQWIITQVLAPILKNLEFEHPQDINSIWSFVRGNNLAKAAIESAIWVAYAKRVNLPLNHVLAQAVGCNYSNHISTGISLGITDFQTVQNQINQALAAGYQKIKLKIRGNQDLKRIANLRQLFPDAPLMVDANGSLQTSKNLAKEIDDLKLLMIEDPFPPTELILSQQLQKHMKTPICFDEPITSVQTALNALYFQQCQIISFKIGALGGLGPTIKLLQVQQKLNFPIWCGAMLEGGIGRVINLAVASLNHFNFASDIAATSHYFKSDLLTTPIELQQGKLSLSAQAGLGFTLKTKYQQKLSQLPSLI